MLIKKFINFIWSDNILWVAILLFAAMIGLAGRVVEANKNENQPLDICGDYLETLEIWTPQDGFMLNRGGLEVKEQNPSNQDKAWDVVYWRRISEDVTVEFVAVYNSYGKKIHRYNPSVLNEWYLVYGPDYAPIIQIFFCGYRQGD